MRAWIDAKSPTILILSSRASARCIEGPVRLTAFRYASGDATQGENVSLFRNESR